MTEDFDADASTAQADFCVSTTGSDANPGTCKKPFLTLHKARDAVRELKKTVTDRDIVVEIEGGTYFLQKALVFDENDSGVNGYRVIYRGRPEQTVRIVGGRRITDWEKAGDNVWRTLLDETSDPQQLFENGVRRTKTRLPEKGYLFTTGVEDKNDPGRAFFYNAEDIPPEMDLDQASVYIWSGFDWFAECQPIAEVDRGSHRIVLPEKTMAGKIEARPRRRYRLYNIRALLGRPGQFFVDHRDGYLYYTPMDGPIEQQEIIVPTLHQLVEFRGSSHEALVRNIELEDLLFDISAIASSFCEIWNDERRSVWNEPVNRKASVYFQNAMDCAVRRCEIRNAGCSGVCMDNFSQNITVRHCLIHDAGYHGVLLAAYNVYHGKLMDLNKRNRIEHNWIHHCGRIIGHGAGIFVHSSGQNHIAHNLIHNMPRYGIGVKNYHYPAFKDKVYEGERVTWENHWDFLHTRYNVIEFNHVHHVNEDSEDCGAISFISCGKGNVVNNNLIHDCPRHPDSGLDKTDVNISIGIYLDDASDFFVVTNNIIYNLGAKGNVWGHGIFAKGIGNEIRNNILVGDAQTATGISLMQYDESPACDHRYTHNIICLTNANGFPIHIFNAKGDYKVDERLARCDFNLYCVRGGRCAIKIGEDWDWVIEDKEILPLCQWQERYNFDLHSLEADPGFVDAEKGDYRLRADSPAWDIGFEPIDLDAIGPQGNPFLSESE